MRLSRCSSASPSSMSSAYMSSDARIFLARVYICFSPVERPLSASRMARFRTTSASSYTSPVLILSRLCLNRRFPFFRPLPTSPRPAAGRFSPAPPPIPRRLAAFSPLDSFQLCVGCGENLVQPATLADDRLDHELRQPGDSPQDPVAAWRHGMVEGVQLAVVAE